MTYLCIFDYLWWSNAKDNPPWNNWNENGHNPPANWASKNMPNIFGTKDPNIELYSSLDTKTISKQADLMRNAGIDVSISSWWGQGTVSDRSFDIKVNIVKPSVKTCIYYEKEGYTESSSFDIINDINYIKTKYAGNNIGSNSYFKINERPVVFVYNIGNDIVKAWKWKQIRDSTGIYLVLKVFPGWQTYELNADSWHEYAPANSYSEIASPYSVFISPGFDKYNEVERLSRDINRFETDLQKLKAANVDFKLIETYNEWNESTGVETSLQYGTTYMDLITKYFGGYGNGGNGNKGIDIISIILAIIAIILGWSLMKK